jgi:hypothetical protein
MFAKIKQVAAAGAAVAGVGWITVVSPGVAYTQPPRIPQGINFTCPDVAGINYVQDPGNSNAYYLCIDGLQQQHLQCPPVAKLIMATPPVCSPTGHHGM